MKRLSILAVAVLLAAFPAGGQNLTTSFRERCDSLSVLVEERTSVRCSLKLSSVKNHNGLLDFYFTGSLGEVPLHPDDIPWLKSTLKEIAPDNCKQYRIGSIYCDGLPVQQLITHPAGNDGTPHQNRWKKEDPKQYNKYPLVREINGQQFHKGLSNRYIALWQSHGRYYEAKTHRWEWQRAPLFTTVEDMYTQSYVLPFLIPMLENAGAYVMTPRERDTQRNESVCDNDMPFSFIEENRPRSLGEYSESGKWEDAGTGFADSKAIYTGNDNPFTMGTARKTACVKDRRGTASAVWTADIRERGKYAVYISYKTLANSSEAAHYTVRHLGGESHFTVNQKMGGGTWIYLGTFEFGAGSDGSVTLDNGTPEGHTFRPGTVVTADAVRFGGGMGKIARGDEETSYELSGLPAFAEGALYSMQWAGIDSTITRKHEDDYTNDYADRGAWVSLMSGGSRVNPSEKGKGIPVDLSFAFHTDAGTTANDSIVGTLAIYTLKCEGSRRLPDGEDRMTARVLADDVQSQIVSDIRAQFNPEWRRRQIWNRSYSECRTGGVPSMILELLSHQNFADMKYGLDPSFRFTVSRAIYKGILKYLSSRYGFHYAVQPLPVNSFSVTIEDGRKAVLRWLPTVDTLETTANPSGYILYTKVDDGGFDNGRIIKPARRNDGSLSFETQIWKGHLYSYRIAAFNDGGRSFPSETLSAGIPEAGCPENRTVLIINNFDRVSAPAWFDTPSHAGFDDRLDAGVPYMYEINRIGEMYQWRRDLGWSDDDNPGFGASFTDCAGRIIPGNTFDYPATHGAALMKAGYAFCSASSSAFVRDSSMFRKYWAADIICGKQVTTPAGSGSLMDNRFRVFPDGLRRTLASFCRNGGNVLVSGANIGTDLWDKVYQFTPDSTYQAESQAFAKDILGYRWLTNYAERNGQARVIRSKGIDLGDFRKPVSFYQLPNSSVYNVETPDGLMPANDRASVFLRYGTTGIPAGVCHDGDGYRSVSIGFPIEVIKDEESRVALMRGVMEYFINRK
ncbi:MAG: xanthan lyase [Candidatus Cryptobacteroides sp.]